MSLRHSFFLAGAVALVAILAGCGARPTAPGSASPASDRDAGSLVSAPVFDADGGGFGRKAWFPLEVGDRWHYREQLTVVLIPTVGDPQSLFTETHSVESEILCEQTWMGRDYAIRRDLTDDGVNVTAARDWLRQDRAGLWLADIDPGAPTPCESAPAITRGSGAAAASTGARWESALRQHVANPARRAAIARAYQTLAIRMEQLRRPQPLRAKLPEGDGGAELRLLPYPVRRGMAWVINPSPHVTGRVEAIESLRLPFGRVPAARVRIVNEFMGPDDRAWVWYSRLGTVQTAFRLIGIATDDQGNVIGTLKSEVSRTADRVHLTR